MKRIYLVLLLIKLNVRRHTFSNLSHTQLTYEYKTILICRVLFPPWFVYPSCVPCLFYTSEHKNLNHKKSSSLLCLSRASQEVRHPASWRTEIDIWVTGSRMENRDDEEAQNREMRKVPKLHGLNGACSCKCKMAFASKAALEILEQWWSNKLVIFHLGDLRGDE